jgi:hypothetical protein
MGPSFPSFFSEQSSWPPCAFRPPPSTIRSKERWQGTRTSCSAVPKEVCHETTQIIFDVFDTCILLLNSIRRPSKGGGALPASERSRIPSERHRDRYEGRERSCLFSNEPENDTDIRDE